LDLTVQYLEALKAGRQRYVAVSAETLASLAAEPCAAPIEAEPVRSAATLQHSNTPTLQHSDTPLSPEAKSQAIADLRERALLCVKCPHLVKTRRQVVFGVGSIDAQLMFVGEAPGADEDAQGEPFVGAAGQLLTKMIQAMGLSRQTVYIANILKCRPDTPAQSYGNRKPTPEEMKTCIPYLHAQIDLIRPKVLVGLGATAIEGLLGANGGITKVRGHWQTYRGIPLMPTFHPSYLLRNQALTERRKVWEDMLQVMERLGLPISDTQRNYFSGK
jgi:uracil-DNA glycosylase family 4